jgi:hypothetical protein
MLFVPFGEYTWKTEAEATRRNLIVGDETEANATATVETIQVIATYPNNSDTEEESDRSVFLCRKVSSKSN